PALCLHARRRAPDAVECVLQLAEHRRRTGDEERGADKHGEDAAFGLACARDQTFDAARAFGADQAGDLLENLAARRLLAEEVAGYPDDNEEEGRDREERVIGNRRAHAGRVVLGPGLDRTAGEPPRVAGIHRPSVATSSPRGDAPFGAPPIAAAA